MKHGFFAVLLLAIFVLGAAAGEPSHRRTTPLTISVFSGLPADLTFPELVRRVGEPDDDIGSGVYIYRYHLADGSLVIVGTADRQKISGITHVVGSERTVLWHRPK